MFLGPCSTPLVRPCGRLGAAGGVTTLPRPHTASCYRGWRMRKKFHEHYFISYGKGKQRLHQASAWHAFCANGPVPLVAHTHWELEASEGCPRLLSSLASRGNPSEKCHWGGAPTCWGGAAQAQRWSAVWRKAKSEPYPTMHVWSFILELHCRSLQDRINTVVRFSNL